MRQVLRAGVLCVVAALAGCATNHGATEISPDTYMISRSDKGGIFGDAAAMKLDVIKEAQAFAAQQGKVAIPLAVKEVPLRPGRFAQIEYQFRVVDKNDPEARRTTLVPRADMVIESNERVKVDAKRDVYGELIKLDDLRKRGVITDTEFEDQKRKLLAQ